MSNSEFERVYATVRSKVLEILGSKAEDIFQEIMYRASTKLDQFENEEQLLAYVWAATAQEFRLRQHRDSRRKDTLRDMARTEPESSRFSDDFAARQAFERACEGLTPEQKEAVWSVVYDSATTRETELSQSAVSRAVARFREKLKEAA